MAGKHEGGVKPGPGDLAIALAYVPNARRLALAALWALDERLAGIVHGSREAMIGRIRLAWWRDALMALDKGPPPAEPLLAALAAEVLPTVSGAEMAAMVAGWDVLLPVDQAGLEIHAAERGERLFALSGRLLGGVPPAGAGAIWARAELRKILLGTGRGTAKQWSGPPACAAPGRGPPPPFAEEVNGPLPRAGEVQGRWPTPLRPLGMLAILARRDPAERAGSPARILAMLRHRLTGR